MTTMITDMENPYENIFKNIKSSEDLYFLTCAFTIGDYVKHLRSALKTKGEIVETVSNLLSNEDIEFDEMNIRSEKFLDEIYDEKFLELSRKKLDRVTKLVDMKESKRVNLIGRREHDSHEFLMNGYNEIYNKKDFID